MGAVGNELPVVFTQGCVILLTVNPEDRVFTPVNPISFLGGPVVTKRTPIFDDVVVVTGSGFDALSMGYFNHGLISNPVL